MKGTVKNSQDAGLTGVSILVRTADGTFGGVSGRKGQYEVEFTAADTATVSFSHIGYQTYTFMTPAADDINHDVILVDKSLTLGEVEVTAENISVKDDHVSYLPTRKQVNGANNGVMLLFNMMLPQLDVSPMDNSVKTVDNSSLAIFVDGRQADAGELSRLRPKDIARFEYFDVPTGIYASANTDHAINIVTKKYRSGGYVDLRSFTQTLYPNGSYTMQSSFDRDDVNLLAMAGSSYYHANQNGYYQEATYKLNPVFTKYTYYDKAKLKSLSDYGLLRSTIRGKRSYFLAQAALSWNEHPEMTTVSSVSYTGNVYPAAKTATTTCYRSLSPSFYLYHQIKFDENNTVDWSANYSFSKNKSRNNYVEGSFDPIINNADEKYHTLGAVMNYNVTFANGGTLGLNISNYFNKSSSEYSGTSPSMQDMSVNEFLVHLGYRHRFGEKFSLGVRVGVDVSTSKINGRQRVTRYYGRPGIDGSYKIDNTSSLSFRAYMGSYVPSLSTKNEAEVRLSRYEVRRGNPDLKDGKPITSGISYSKYWKKFSLSAYVDYNATLDNTVAYYTVEDNTLINTYLTSGTYNNVLVGASGVFRLFDNSLQLRLTAGFRHTTYPASMT